MNVRRLCQKEGLDDDSPHGASPPLSTSSFKQVGLATTHLLLLQLQPLLLFWIQKAPTMPTLLGVPTWPALSIPHREFHLILPSPFHTIVLQTGHRVEKVWIFQMCNQRSTPTNPTRSKASSPHHLQHKITIIKIRIVLLNLIYIPICFLVASSNYKGILRM